MTSYMMSSPLDGRHRLLVLHMVEKEGKHGLYHHQRRYQNCQHLPANAPLLHL